MCFKDDWTPAPANINALPERLRGYIHDLKTVCDPAGDVTELFRLQTENRMLRWECERLAAPTRAKLSRISIRQKEKYGPVSTLSGRLDCSRQWGWWDHGDLSPDIFRRERRFLQSAQE